MKPDFSIVLDYISKKGKNSLFVVLGIIGIFLILVGDMNFTDNSEKNTCSDISLQEYKTRTEKELTALLREIEGVGDVRVMITLESGTENIYVQQEKNVSDEQKQLNGNDSSQTSRSTFENEIVMVESSGSNTALVEKTIQPTVQGVAVVCRGADDIKVVSDVTNSVSVVLGVPTHKICVTKMR